jgi:hypothetical protein
MSSFLGDLWSSVYRIASQARLNLKTNLVGTGDQILGKSTGSLQKGMIASVTDQSTGGGLKAGIFQWNGSAWTSPTGGIHTHQSTSDGGTFQSILEKAIQNTWFVNKLGVTKAEFYTSGTGGTYSDVISGTDAYVQIDSGATLNNSGNLRYGGINYSFNNRSAFVTRIQLANSTTTSQARVGMNMETSDSVTNNKPKYGFEGCSTCNSSSMSIISANSTTNNRSKNTTSTDSYSALGNYIMVCDPNINVKYRKETGTIITKTTDVPASGAPDRANAWLCGIQATAGSAARQLKLYGFQAIGTITELPVI